MKHIVKSDNPPDFLENWLRRRSKQLIGRSGNEQWNLFKKNRAHQKLQVLLAEEQGYVCAYCNRQIHSGIPEDDEQSRIDHLQPKGRFPDQTFNYQNLVSSCHGNERVPKPREVHCDSQKNENELPAALFPTNLDCELQFRVSDEGLLVTSNPIIQKGIEETLNLNCAKLIVLRKSALAPFAETHIEPSEVDTMIAAYKVPDENGRLEPFCGIIINFLRQYSE
ncbi:MAG: TIGR02646 family protein [Phaeodactylibacter sp.]|nr:TIGR02646 family protein [Phaeodactylibacter sp.]